MLSASRDPRFLFGLCILPNFNRSIQLVIPKYHRTTVHVVYMMQERLNKTTRNVAQENPANHVPPSLTSVKKV